METDNTKLFEALCKAQAEFKEAVKLGFNPHFKSSFVDLPELIRATRPALAKYGLSITQALVYQDGEQFIETELGHVSGQSKRSLMKLNAEKPTAQSMGSAITYAKRYAYGSLLCIAIVDDSDDDGNEAVGVKKAEPSPQQYDIATVTQEQLEQLDDELAEHPEIKDNILLSYKIKSLNQIPKDKFLSIIKRIREIKRHKEDR